MRYDFDAVIERRGTYAIKWHRGNADTIPLMVADMDLQSPQPVIDAMHRVADHKMYGYSMHVTDPAYFSSLCGWFERRHGWHIEEDQIIPSHGTFGALTHVAHMYAKPGNGIIVMDPVYGHFSQDIVMWGNEPIRCHLINDNGYYTINYDLLEQQASDPNNTLLIFCNPHNPVGRVWTAEEIKKVSEICEKHGVFVISDEVHCDHIRKGQHYTPYLTVCADKGNAISMVGINKSFNMAGLACSNAIVQDKALFDKIMESYHMPMLTPFAIAGHIAAFTEGDEWMDQVCAYIEGNIDWAIDFFKKELPKVVIHKPEGTYCLWMDFRAYGLSDEEVHKRIYEDANVLLQDGTVHDPVEGHCFQRMCVPCARSVLMEACQRIVKVFEDVR